MPSRETCVIENDKVYKFSLAGEFVEECFLEPRYTNGMSNLPIISILASKGHVEVAVIHDGQTLLTKDIEAPFSSVIMRVQANKGFVRVLNRKGAVEGVSFTQTLFVYPENFDLNVALNGLIFKEGNK